MSRLSSTNSIASTSKTSNPESIESLSKHLFEQINTVFDPSIHNKSDDYFMSDYSNSDKYSDASSGYKNPYEDLSERVKNHIRKAEAGMSQSSTSSKKPHPKKRVNYKETGETFQLTNVGLEGDMRMRRLQEEEEQLKDVRDGETPDYSMEDIMKTLNTATGDVDDLAELRRMIKETKKEMKNYGKEMLTLKNSVTELNAYANNELGYKASDNHMVDMEYQLNSLKGKKGFKYISKNNISSTAALRSLKSTVNDPPKPKTSTSIGGTTTTSYSRAGQQNSALKPQIQKNSIKSKNNQFIIRQQVKDPKEVDYVKGSLK